MAAAMDMAGTEAGSRRVAREARRYLLVDRASGEEYEVDAARLEQVVGVETAYLDWVIAEDGAFENARWRVHEAVAP